MFWSLQLHMLLGMKYKQIPKHTIVIFQWDIQLEIQFTKLSFVWDVQIMFEYFKSLGDNIQISEKYFWQKFLILPLLLRGQHLNSVFHFTIAWMILSSTNVIFSPKHVLKHLKPGWKWDIFQYWAYSDSTFCVLECI